MGKEKFATYGPHAKVDQLIKFKNKIYKVADVKFHDGKHMYYETVDGKKIGYMKNIRTGKSNIEIIKK